MSAPAGVLRRLQGMDAAFLYLESLETPMHLTAMYLYDQSESRGRVLRRGDLLRFVADRLELSPVFRQRLVRVPLELDRPYWVSQDEVDVRRHVRFFTLPGARDWEQLCEMAARLHTRPLDLRRPPWEIDIIEGLDHVEGLAAGSFAVLLKCHHAAVDGAAGYDILGALTDTRPLQPPAAEPTPIAPPPEPDDPAAAGLLVRAAVHGITLPLELGRRALDVIPAIPQLLRSVGRDPVAGTFVPSTRFNRALSPRRVVDGTEFALADLRAIKEAVPGATVNDVVLAICGGALRSYLAAKDELPKRSLVAGVPVSTRVPGQPVAPGNDMTVMTAPLHTEVADPLERLAAIQAATRQAKKQADEGGVGKLAELICELPTPAMALGARLVNVSHVGAHLPAIANCVITNVPGPPGPLYLWGARLRATYGFGPLISGMGLLIFATSYHGGIFLSFTSCRGIVDDPHVLVQYLRESFDALRDAASG